MRIARVALAAPVRQLFDYLVPREQPLPSAGARVRVPFGPKRSVIGIVVATARSSAVPKERLKPIFQVLDSEPLLPESSLSLLAWAASYYHHPIGEVMASALPVTLRRRNTPGGEAKVWTITAAGSAAEMASVRRAPVQQRLLRALKAAPHGLMPRELTALSQRWRPAIGGLVARGWVAVHEHSPMSPGEHAFGEPPPLTPPQQVAVNATMAARGFKPFLLFGVTGSGKTEVYLRLIRAVLDRGEKALMLVPEIGLTPQVLGRFRERFDAPIAVLHSGMSDRERTRVWLMAASGKAPLVIGTRSAVFTPLPQLGVIIVDEEHDVSYKQQDRFHYSARDVAVMRAMRQSIPVVLGSATPSLETLNRARTGAYESLILRARAQGALLPVIELLDMRRLAVDGGVSHPLRVAMAEALQNGDQVLLFLNRRGFAPIWMCFHCGWVAPCERCDARLTYHRAGARLRCHHCGLERAPIDVCPHCRQAGLHALGEGTERVEATLGRQFPNARIVRIDRDSTSAKGALEAKLARVRAGDADILIGTQMLSKGHDFPNVTLVGVLNADQGLYASDFRADERLVQQIIQVSGRAGRAAKPGRVLLQTYHPDHPVFGALRRLSYDEFADYALAERRDAGFPPFSYLALLRAESPKAQAALEFLRAAHDLAKRCTTSPSVEIMEPVSSPMERRAGRYRAQLLIRSGARAPLHTFLDSWLERLGELKQSRRVRWSIDVDPSDLY